MKTESEFAVVYLDFIRKYSIPSAILRDDAKLEMSQSVKDIHRDLIIADQWAKLHSPWQNSAELNGVKYLKSYAKVVLNWIGAQDNLWFLSQDYLEHVHNLSANRQINWKIPEQLSKGGEIPDIFHILMFYWFEPVVYLDPVSKFPETTERPGYFVGFADSLGDALTFKTLKNYLVTVLHRIVVRSAADANHQNRRVSFKSDVQESLKLLDTKPSLTFVWKNSHHKYKSRKTNKDVSNRTRSKADYTDQHIGSRTRSKIQNVIVHNLSIQNLFFPLHDAILFQGHGKSQAQDVQLGVLECKVYHNVLLNTKSQVDYDRLLQLHMLDQTEEDKVMSWKCHKVVDYHKENGDDHCSNHNSLMEGNNIN
jgi:hypothetical protein